MRTNPTWNATATVAAAERPTDVLATLSAAVYDRLYPAPVGDPARGGRRRRNDDEWVPVADLLVDDAAMEPLVAAACRRFRSDDRGLVVAQVARESISALATVAVELWGRQRRLFDLSAANVALRPGEVAVIAGLRQPALWVLPDDPMADRDDVTVIDGAEMFDHLIDQAIGYPVPAGAVPPGQPGSIAAVAAIVASVRRTVRCGDRHLWGTAALAVGSTLARVSHTLGRRADEDREAIFATRPDLFRTVELCTVDDGPGQGPDGEITFALRRTCCLLFKLPDGSQCGSCSLRPREPAISSTADWHRNERRRLRG